MTAKTDHPAIVQPNDNSCVIWRYLDISKFADLLLSSNLYFSRIDLLGDIFECAMPLEVFKRDVERLKIDPENRRFTSNEHYHQWMRVLRDNANKEYFVNCWHMSQHESAAMWNMYYAERNVVAIKSTYDKLVTALDSDVFVGCVSYLDYQFDAYPAGNQLYQVFAKDVSFSHEKEIRAVKRIPLIQEQMRRPAHTRDRLQIEIPDPVDSPSGWTQRIEASELIDGVFVSPDASPLFGTVVARLSEHFLPKIPVFPSKLLDEPFF